MKNFPFLFTLLLFFCIDTPGQSVNPIFGDVKSMEQTNNPIGYIVDGNTSTSIEIPANTEYFNFSIFLFNSARVKDICLLGGNLNQVQSLTLDCSSFDSYDGEADEINTYTLNGSSISRGINNINSQLNAFRIDIQIKKTVGVVVSISEIYMDGIIDAIDASSGNDLSLRTNLSPRITIKSGTGNIGIGTTDPGTYKLNVSGRVRANEIVVNTTGADFVFEPTFKLRPLAEVEAFIKVNKHLPDIAPATDMQTSGVSMGDMQAKLLQKVEELTLYVIEQQKKNAALEQKLVEQDTKYQLLLKEIEELKKK